MIMNNTHKLHKNRMFCHFLDVVKLLHSHNVRVIILYLFEMNPLEYHIVLTIKHQSIKYSYMY